MFHYLKQAGASVLALDELVSSNTPPQSKDACYILTWPSQPGPANLAQMWQIPVMIVFIWKQQKTQGGNNFAFSLLAVSLSTCGPIWVSLHSIYYLLH